MTETFSIDGIKSLPEALFRSAEQHAGSPAQWYREQGVYLPVTYAQLVTQIRHTTSGLLRDGFKAGDRIGLLMENRPEWAVIDYAILSIGAVTVPLYCSYRASDIAYVLNDSGAVAVLTSGNKLLRHVLKATEQCKQIKQVYVVDSTTEAEHTLIKTLVSLQAGEIEEEKLEKCLANIDKNTLASIVYTSGTTANPKGVMLTHGNFITNLESVPASIDLTAGEHGDCMLSFLPLAHALERTGGHFLTYSFGLSVAFAERPDTVAKNMSEARPTMMISVPRMLEVVRNRILSQVSQQSGFKQALFQAFLKLALKKWARNEPLGLIASLQLRLLDKLVGEKIRLRFGGRLRVFVCGGAPLSVEVAEFFEALKLPVIEGYGLTESAPLLAVNPMSDRRLGTVGVAGKGVELKIADDGEILARGGNIMPGYWRNKKATRETLIDGWLHTGDIGRLCPDGYLSITDRKKDIIVNSGGENIAPQRIEGLLTVDEAIDQMVVYGDQKPYLVALVVPNEDACTAWAKTQGLPESDWQHLCESEVLKKYLQNKIGALLKPLNPFEQVRRIHLLQQPFSIEAGTLTPTMKVKRRAVYKQYADTIAALYG
ncbi:long-chain fatty acid--CoA ligase [Mariprofundus ferrooxydans]|nr:long-chain fatty acid--CoA ligase [Mariprofundus ferrooxydans]